MQTITSGHLSNNGGLRGHSAGDIFPWRVVITGTFDSLKYWVVNPAGEKAKYPHGSYGEAHNLALTCIGAPDTDFNFFTIGEV